MSDAGDLGGAQVLGEDGLDRVGVEGEGDALGAVAQGDVDADQLAVDVEQRAARVAGVDAGVGLDQVRSASRRSAW